MLQEIGWQAVAAAHRIFSVMVEQQANGVGVHGVGIAGLQHQDVWVSMSFLDSDNQESFPFERGDCKRGVGSR